MFWRYENAHWSLAKKKEERRFRRGESSRRRLFCAELISSNNRPARSRVPNALRKEFLNFSNFHTSPSPVVARRMWKSRENLSSQFSIHGCLPSPRWLCQRDNTQKWKLIMATLLLFFSVTVNLTRRNLFQGELKKKRKPFVPVKLK